MVSSRATDMYFVSENGETKLNDYITSLRNDISILQNYNNELDSYNKELEKSVKALETEISNMKNNFETTIKDIVKNYLIGIENEIKVSEVDEKLTIGFDDNAIFGEI